MLVLCWPKLSLCCPMLTLCWPKLPLSCPYIDPMFAYVGRGNALPHSSDRNDGGDDGVGRGWGGGHPKLGRRLGRHASITFGYHRRPPARTRAAWPAPGFKGYRPCRRPQQCAVVCQVSIILVNDLAKPLRLSDSKQLKYLFGSGLGDTLWSPRWRSYEHE